MMEDHDRHIAEVTERAVREQVSDDIMNEMNSQGLPRSPARQMYLKALPRLKFMCRVI